MSDYYDTLTGEEVTDSEAHDRFNDYLDEVLGDVTVGTLTYSASRVLSEVDPIAYRCEFSDWTSDEDSGIIESGYWVRVLTDDGQIHSDGDPAWFTDEDDARDSFRSTVAQFTDPAGEDTVTVQLYDTAGDMLAEQRVSPDAS